MRALNSTNEKIILDSGRYINIDIEPFYPNIFPTFLVMVSMFFMER